MEMATAEVVPCGSLYCQKNCFSRHLTSLVVSCSPTKGGEYEVTLTDTVLFPEGGGQVGSIILRFPRHCFFSLA